MNQDTKEETTTDIEEPPKLTYYQRNRDKLRLKAKKKYAEKKLLGITDHQVFMRSIEPTICCPNCQHVFKMSQLKKN